MRKVKAQKNLPDLHAHGARSRRLNSKDLGRYQGKVSAINTDDVLFALKPSNKGTLRRPVIIIYNLGFLCSLAVSYWRRAFSARAVTCFTASRCTRREKSGVFAARTASRHCSSRESSRGEKDRRNTTQDLRRLRRYRRRWKIERLFALVAEFSQAGGSLRTICRELPWHDSPRLLRNPIEVFVRWLLAFAVPSLVTEEHWDHKLGTPVNTSNPSPARIRFAIMFKSSSALKY
jgi:hypothetical protein